MAVYTYYIANVLTGQVLGDLPFSDTKLAWTLSDTGTFEGKLNIADPEVLTRGGLDLTHPGQHAVYVDRDGDLLWAGIIWSRKRSRSEDTLTVQAADYWSYFGKRLCTVDITHSGDIMALVAAILAPALDSHKPANLTVAYTTPPDTTPPAQNIEYTYAASDRKKVSELVSGLAEGTPSFDFRLSAQWTVTGFSAAVVLTFGRPYLGAPAAGTAALFDFPGNITSYEEDEDGSELVGRLFVRGSSAGDDAAAPEFTYEDTALYATYPRYEDAIGVDESNASVVNLRGQAAYNRRKTPPVVRALSVRADVDPAIGSYDVGDATQLVLRDGAFVGTVALRIGAMSLTPADEVVEITPWEAP